jgi:hypothetical protein
MTKVDGNTDAKNKRYLITFRTNRQLSSQQITVTASFTVVLKTTEACSSARPAPDYTTS